MGLAFGPVGESKRLCINTRKNQFVILAGRVLELTRLGVHHHEPFKLRLVVVVRDDGDDGQDDTDDEDISTSDDGCPLPSNVT